MNSGLFDTEKYTLEDELENEQALIIKAHDNELNLDVAIKALNDQLRGLPEAEAGLVEESQLLARVQSDNVVRVLHFFDKGVIGDRSYLVMEWMDKSLSQVLSDRVLNQATALDVLKKIVRGLVKLHQEGILHNNLTPDNILVSDDCSQVKIGDFGAASELGLDKAHKFSPQYTAPENYYPEKPVGYQSDIYALGMIAMELFLGSERFMSAFSEIYAESDPALRNSRWQHWNMNQAAVAKPLSELDSTIPQAVSDLVAKMLAKDVSQRYFEINELMTDLIAIDETAVAYIQPLRPEDYLRDTEPESLITRLLQPRSLALLGLVIVSLSICGFLVMQHLEQKKLETSFLNALTTLKELRTKVIELGGDESMEQFVAGEESFSSAKQFYQQEDLRASFSSVIEAGKHYKVVLTTLESLLAELRSEMSGRREQVLGYLELVRPEAVSETLEQARANYGGWLGEAKIQDLQTARQDEIAWLEQLEGVLAAAPRNFSAGSSEDEINGALKLCNQVSVHCSADWYTTEASREVVLRPFTLDSTEVTYGDFTEFVTATDYVTTAERLGYSHVFDGEKSVQTSGISWRSQEGMGVTSTIMPVTHIGPEDATAYCNWQSARLPSEDEWEYASRGPERYQFSWGDQWDPGKITGESSAANSLPVAGYFSELRGMTGSLWEWVVYEGGVGLKGGSYLETSPANFRSAARREAEQQVINVDDGFRCARDADFWPSHRGDTTIAALRE